MKKLNYLYLASILVLLTGICQAQENDGFAYARTSSNSTYIHQFKPATINDVCPAAKEIYKLTRIIWFKIHEQTQRSSTKVLITYSDFSVTTNYFKDGKKLLCSLPERVSLVWTENTEDKLALDWNIRKVSDNYTALMLVNGDLKDSTQGQKDLPAYLKSQKASIDEVIENTK